MIDMVKGQIIPAVFAYQKEILAVLNGKKSDYDTALEQYFIENISRLSGELLCGLKQLEELLAEKGNSPQQADYYCNKIIPAMNNLRTTTDSMETFIAKEHWPLPSYGELLHSVT
jgi:glutamine synthetase